MDGRRRARVGECRYAGARRDSVLLCKIAISTLAARITHSVDQVPDSGQGPSTSMERVDPRGVIGHRRPSRGISPIAELQRRPAGRDRRRALEDGRAWRALRRPAAAGPRPRAIPTVPRTLDSVPRRLQDAPPGTPRGSLRGATLEHMVPVLCRNSRRLCYRPGDSFVCVIYVAADSKTPDRRQLVYPAPCRLKRMLPGLLDQRSLRFTQRPMPRVKRLLLPIRADSPKISATRRLRPRTTRRSMWKPTARAKTPRRPARARFLKVGTLSASPRRLAWAVTCSSSL
jgi:hypothetical protein